MGHRVWEDWGSPPKKRQKFDDNESLKTGTTTASSTSPRLQSRNEALLTVPVTSLTWLLQAVKVIHEELKSFLQPAQICNQVLIRIYNNFITLTEWFGIEIDNDETIKCSCAQLLLLLTKIPNESVTRSGMQLDHDRLEMSQKSCSVGRGKWTNPKFSRWIIEKPSEQALLLKLTLSVQNCTSNSTLRDFIISENPLNDVDVFVLGVISMIKDIWTEMWSRLRKICLSLTDPEFYSSFSEEILSLLNLDYSNHGYSSVAHAKSLIFMHLPQILNENERLLQSIKLPSDCYESVVETLGKIRDLQVESQPFLDKLQNIEVEDKRFFTALGGHENDDKEDVEIWSEEYHSSESDDDWGKRDGIAAKSDERDQRQFGHKNAEENISNNSEKKIVEILAQDKSLSVYDQVEKDKLLEPSITKNANKNFGCPEGFQLQNLNQSYFNNLVSNAPPEWIETSYGKDVIMKVDGHSRQKWVDVNRFHDTWQPECAVNNRTRGRAYSDGNFMNTRTSDSDWESISSISVSISDVDDSRDKTKRRNTSINGITDPDLESPMKGVYFSRVAKSWHCVWYDQGQRRIKSFPINLYGFSDAKQKAIELRKKVSDIAPLKHAASSRACEQRDKWWLLATTAEAEQLDLDQLLHQAALGNVEQVHLQGVCYDRCNKLWRTVWDRNEDRQSVSFSDKIYGYKHGRQLAIIARIQAEKTGSLPNRSTTIQFFESIREIVYEGSRIHSETTERGKNHNGENETTEDEIRDHENNIGDQEASNGGKKKNSNMSETSFAEEDSSLKESGISSREEGSAEIFNSGVTGVTFNRFNASWNAKRPGSVLTFSAKVLGFEESKQIAIFAREIYVKTGKIHSRSQILSMFQSKKSFLMREESAIHNADSDPTIGCDDGDDLKNQTQRGRASTGRQSGRGVAGSQGVTFDKRFHKWTGWFRSGEGYKQSYTFAASKYGQKAAKELAILTRKEAERINKLPSREAILKLYKSLHGGLSEEDVEELGLFPKRMTSSEDVERESECKSLNSFCFRRTSPLKTSEQQAQFREEEFEQQDVEMITGVIESLCREEAIVTSSSNCVV